MIDLDKIGQNGPFINMLGGTRYFQSICFLTMGFYQYVRGNESNFSFIFFTTNGEPQNGLSKAQIKIERGRPVIAFKHCLIVNLKKPNIVSA